MSAIENYYDLTEDIRLSDFKVRLYQKDVNEEAELIKEIENNKNMYQHLNKIKVELSKNTEDADSIRTAFVYVANGVLDSFKKIEGWGFHYPDLNQGMNIKGYLFGKIVSDFKTALKFEGGHPIVEIYMSEDKWDYEPLKQLIANLKQELVNSHFTNKMQAIEYFEHIRASVFGLIDQLKKQGVI
jgi:hypothetical protein